jgi:hypothetical protein
MNKEERPAHVRGWMPLLKLVRGVHKIAQRPNIISLPSELGSENAIFPNQQRQQRQRSQQQQQVFINDPHLSHRIANHCGASTV